MQRSGSDQIGGGRGVGITTNLPPVCLPQFSVHALCGVLSFVSKEARLLSLQDIENSNGEDGNSNAGELRKENCSCHRIWICNTSEMLQHDAISPHDGMCVEGQRRRDGAGNGMVMPSR